MGHGKDAGSRAKPLILPKTKVARLPEQEWKQKNPVKKIELSAISEKKKKNSKSFRGKKEIGPCCDMKSQALKIFNLSNEIIKSAGVKMLQSYAE